MRSRIVLAGALVFTLGLAACSTAEAPTAEVIVVTATAEPAGDASTTLPPEMLGVEW